MSENHKSNLGGKLLSIESIFKWKPVIYEENLNEIICECEPASDNEFNFFNFIIKLIQSFIQEDKNAAFDILNDLELAAAKFTEDKDFKRIEDSYYHMIYASKICLLSETKKHDEASVLLDKIKSVEDMDDFNKSAIHAMKSAVFAMYSNEDTQKATASIEKALKLDADNARWHFLKGLYKRKERRMTNPFLPPSLIEKESFEKAFENNPNNVVYKLSVADAYREISGHATKRKENCSHFLPKDSSFNENLRENIDSKIQLAADYYKEAAEEYSDCPYVMFRCAEGLSKLPQTVSDVKLAKKLAKDGLKKSPDNVAGNLIMAFLCEYIDKNSKEAQKYLKKCQEKKVFQAEMNMIRLLHRTKPEKFDGVEALKILLEKYREKSRQAILYSQMVSYYIFVEIKYDLVKACDCAIKFFSLNCTTSCMQVHRSCFLSTREPFSLIDVLTDEVKYVMNGRKTSDEIQLSCDKFIQYMNFQNIPITKGFPQNFRQQILQGKTLNPNPNVKSHPSRKYDQQDDNSNRRKSNAGKGDATRDRKPQANNHRTQTSNNAAGRQNKEAEQKPPNKVECLPSLMDKPIANPASKEKTPEVKHKQEEEKPAVTVEKQKEEPSEKSKNSSADDDSDDEKLIRKVRKLIKKQKQAQRDKKSEDKTKSRRSHDSEESEDELLKLLKEMGFGDKKSTRKKKKHYSDSEDSSDSEYRRRKDRRRDRSRSDSDNRRRRHHHHRRHKRHSSTDSDYSSRSHRHKSHRKDRYERDTSSRDRRHRRNRSHSPDEDFGGSKGKSTHHRDDSISSQKRRRGRADKSVSPERRRRDREDSVSSRSTRNRSPSYDKRRTANRKESKTKSAGKSHHRDSSRDKYEDHRGSNAMKSRKKRDPNSVVRSDRDENSPHKHYDQSGSN